MTRKIPLFVCAALAAAMMLAAATARAEDPYERADARVPIVVESWVATTTAEAEVVADLTLVNQDPETARTAVMDRIAALVPGARWRVTAFNRTSDAAGAQRWNIRATARIDQSKLDALGASVAKASRPGMKLRLGRVDTSPSLEEREAALKELRKKVYQMALDERAAAKALWPGRDIMVRQVEFLHTDVMPRPRMLANTRAEMAAAPAPDGVSSERRIVLRALVTLAPVTKK